MKKIYCLVDIENGEVIFASKSQKFLEEILMDAFMEQYRQDMQQAVDEHWLDMENITEEDRAFSRETWNSLMTWINSTIKIQKVEII